MWEHVEETLAQPEVFDDASGKLEDFMSGKQPRRRDRFLRGFIHIFRKEMLVRYFIIMDEDMSIVVNELMTQAKSKFPLITVGLVIMEDIHDQKRLSIGTSTDGFPGRESVSLLKPVTWSVQKRPQSIDSQSTLVDDLRDALEYVRKSEPLVKQEAELIKSKEFSKKAVEESRRSQMGDVKHRTPETNEIQMEDYSKINPKKSSKITGSPKFPQLHESPKLVHPARLSAGTQTETESGPLLTTTSKLSGKKRVFPEISPIQLKSESPSNMPQQDSDAPREVKSNPAISDEHQRDSGRPIITTSKQQTTSESLSESRDRQSTLTHTTKRSCDGRDGACGEGESEQNQQLDAVLWMYFGDVGID
ncbi:hypothetical protein CCHR01_03883 [Colletotrichum chrysophilum]|uniref:Uncharacterized protein n=1 Tax=Colletotrichum chrysophilum TaxID=1836956 RepID=A0AAD9EQY8_9PEZI|nr:hypothetical protein CCHR01_03883 [Colletotrichum chrysophilum]